MVLDVSNNNFSSSFLWKTVFETWKKYFSYFSLKKTVLDTLKKDFGYFTLKKTVLNNLGKLCQEIMGLENGVRYFKA